MSASRTGLPTQAHAHAARGPLARLVAAMLAVALPCVLTTTQASAQAAETAFVPVFDADGFLRATPGRVLVLPEDHGSHPDTRTEWWYLTGAFRAEAAADAADTVSDSPVFGFQATWFRRALVAHLPEGRSPLATRDVMLYHGALTDVAAGALSFHEQSSRAYAPWAHAAVGRLDVALLDCALVAETPRAAAPGHRASDTVSPATRSAVPDASDIGTAGGAHLRCRVGDGVLDVQLDLSACAPLLHGAEPGLSLKGDESGQASWYYSLPRLPLHGTLQRPGRPDLAVSGHAWFDHEFGSSQLSARQAGWDWFSVALDDGSDLMLYRMRHADGSADAASAGTFRDAGGAARHLGREQFSLTEAATWTSPRTGAAYPSGWTLAVPEEDLLLSVEPLLADQELVTPGSTGVTYWEGLCRYHGTRAGRAVSGEGYVELVGYAGHVSERL